MNRWPNLRAMLLAASTLAGLVGMMIFDGVWDALFLLLASVPVAIGLVTVTSRGR